MRLVDLKPRWIQPANWAALAPPFYIGLSFDCPHCKPVKCPTCGHLPEVKRLAVKFWPPIDTQGVAKSFQIAIPDHGGHRRTGGETFDTLTLAPSIGFDEIGHWHGHLTNGEVTSS
jgi:hypothetical protein